MSDSQYVRLEALAAADGKPVEQYVAERLFAFATAAEQVLVKYEIVLAGRIHDGLAGKVTSKGVTDILNEELKEKRI